MHAKFQEDTLPPKKKKKKKSAAVEAAEPQSSQSTATEVVPDPFRVDESQLDLSALEVAGKKFRQFRCGMQSCTQLGSFNGFCSKIFWKSNKNSNKSKLSGIW